MGINLGDKFFYRGFGGCDSHCYIRVVGNNVLCTESPDNHGTSVTNMAEFIAKIICDSYNIPMDKVVWFEHYLRDRYGDFPEDFDLVTFTILNGNFTRPVWKPADRNLVEEVFGRG